MSESHSRDIEKILKTENEKFNKILTLSKKAESVEFSGIQVKSDAIESISTKTTQKQLNADYRILKIGVEADGSFSVRLEDIKTGFKFNARIDDIISHPEELAKLNKVFFERNVAYLYINALFDENELKSAYVVSILSDQTHTNKK